MSRREDRRYRDDGNRSDREAEAARKANLEQLRAEAARKAAEKQKGGK